jgi:hypothetical protein
MAKRLIEAGTKEPINVSIRLDANRLPGDGIFRV